MLIFVPITKKEHHQWIQNIWISLDTKFYETHKALINCTSSLKRAISGPKLKNKYHQHIPQIQISLSAIFPLQQIILIVLDYTKQYKLNNIS